MNATVKEKPQFLNSDVFYAYVTLLLGYLFVRLFPMHTSPLGATLWLFVLYGATFGFLKKRGHRATPLAYIIGISGLLISLTLILSANATLAAIASLYALLAYTLSVACLTDRDKRISFSDHLLADTLRSSILMPFDSMDTIAFAATSPKSFRSSGKLVLKILLGIALAIVPTLIIGVLLSYDDGFRSIMSSLFSFGFGDVFREFAYIVFTIPVACLLYGLYHSAHMGNTKDALSKETCQKAGATLRMLSPITALTFSIPFFFVYAVFFFSQWEYYVSAFSGVLPKGVETYAEYARSGFFQLCTVAALNALILLFTGLCTKRREGEGRAHPLIRVLHILFSVCSLILIATALSKLFLYIDRFGMTQKRIYAGFFMLLLTALFLLVIIKQFCTRLQLLAIWCTICVSLFGVLGVMDMDGYIASYNVDRYLSGANEDIIIDMEQLTDLDDAAIPALVHLAENAPSKNIRTQARNIIENWYSENGKSNHSVWKWTLPYQKAVSATENYLTKENTLP